MRSSSHRRIMVRIMQSMTKLMSKNQGTSKNNQRKKQTHRQQTHTQTKTQGQKIQHSQSAFPRVPETRFQETGHPSWPILPMSLCSLWTAKGSAVHCELHDFKVVKKQHTLQFTKFKAQPWPLAQHSGFTTPNQVQ